MGRRFNSPRRTYVDRLHIRALALRTLVASSLLLSCLFIANPTPAFAEDEDLEGGGIEWVDGWEAGKAAAAKSGKLIFLYFGRKSPG
jgi:hypothetical protein